MAGDGCALGNRRSALLLSGGTGWLSGWGNGGGWCGEWGAGSGVGGSLRPLGGLIQWDRFWFGAGGGVVGAFGGRYMYMPQCESGWGDGDG